MGGGNGAKAASQRRQARRKVSEESPKSSHMMSTCRLDPAMDVQCNICKATFLKTSRAPALTEHATNKHSKTLPECFPNFVVA